MVQNAPLGIFYPIAGGVFIFNRVSACCIKEKSSLPVRCPSSVPIFANGAATAAFAAALTAAMNGEIRKNNHSSGPHEKNPHTKTGQPATGRHSFDSKTAAEIDARISGVNERLVGTKLGNDFKEASAALAMDAEVVAIADQYKIEIGGVITPEGTLMSFGTDYHHSQLLSAHLIPGVGSGNHSWHTHPGVAVNNNYLGAGIRKDYRGFSRGDFDVADSAGGWSFARNSDGSLYGLNAASGLEYSYNFNSSIWEVTGRSYVR